MRYLGIDFGTKKVGIAMSNKEGTIAFPRETHANDAELLLRIIRLVSDEQVDTIVVGDTRAASGAPNPVSAAADRFIHDLEKNVSIPVVRGFEAWSSVEASRYAPKGSEHDDSAAAAIILQRYLDSIIRPE